MNHPLTAILGQLLTEDREDNESSTVKPATWQQARSFLYPATKFAIGDIVTMREDASKEFRFPRQGENAVVTQVLDAPYRSGSHSTHEASGQSDFAIAFIDENDRVFEMLYDSRHFVKVGSIYDPLHLADGEELPVR